MAHQFQNLIMLASLVYGYDVKAFFRKWITSKLAFVFNFARASQKGFVTGNETEPMVKGSQRDRLIQHLCYCDGYRLWQLVPYIHTGSSSFQCYFDSCLWSEMTHRSFLSL